MTRAVLLALALYVATGMCFVSYTAGVISGVKMSHTRPLTPSDIGF